MRSLLSKRGQVALFFALGLVILIIIALLYLVLGRTSTTQAPEATDIANNRVLNQYVSNCLETVMDDDLQSLGQSGGISLMTGANFPSAEVQVDGKPVRIIYGITRNARQAGDIIPYPASPPPDGPINYPGVNVATMSQ